MPSVGTALPLPPVSRSFKVRDLATFPARSLNLRWLHVKYRNKGLQVSSRLSAVDSQLSVNLDCQDSKDGSPFRLWPGQVQTVPAKSLRNKDLHANYSKIRAYSFYQYDRRPGLGRTGLPVGCLSLVIVYQIMSSSSLRRSCPDGRGSKVLTAKHAKDSQWQQRRPKSKDWEHLASAGFRSEAFS